MNEAGYTITDAITGRVIATGEPTLRVAKRLGALAARSGQLAAGLFQISLPESRKTWVFSAEDADVDEPEFSNSPRLTGRLAP